MSASTTEIVAEISTLQRRRGLQDPKPWNVGPHIRQALRLDELEGNESQRQALVRGLLDHAEVLQPDLRYVFVAACALNRLDRPNLSERVERVSSVLQVAERTIWRRLSDANRRVAESLGAMVVNGTAAPADWVLLRLSSVVNLQESRPTYHSAHTIRVISPRLEQMSESFSFPGAAPDADPEFRVEGACTLERVERPFQSTWVVHMLPRRPYVCGELLTYRISLRSPSEQVTHPMAVMCPLRTCRSFSAEVDFGSPSRASRVWLLDGVPPPVAEIDEPCGDVIDPVTSQRVRVSYDSMERGRVYGVRWQWAAA